MKTLIIATLLLCTLSACTLAPTKLTADQSTRLDTAKAECTKASVFPKVHPAESRNQSGVRTAAFYDCMRAKGFTER